MVRKLFAVAALFGVLGMSNLWAVGMPSDHKTPNKCGPDCGGGGGGGQYFKAAVQLHVVNDNQLAVYGQPLTQNQWTSQATAMQNALQEGENNGMWQRLDQFIKDNQGLFEAQNPDYSKLYPALQAAGFQGSDEQLIVWLDKETQQQRIAWVNTVLKIGFEGVLTQVIALDNKIGNGRMGIFNTGGIINPMKLPADDCYSIEITSSGLLFAAAIMACVPAMQGAAALYGLVGAGFGLVASVECAS